MMEILSWNSFFEIGIKEIDTQHRKLVGLINQLGSCYLKNPKEDTLEDVYEKLTDYAAFHFESEERIWNKYLPNLTVVKAHEDNHSTFINSIKHLKDNPNNQTNAELIKDISLFLTRWLTHHILKDDMFFGKTILEIEAGSSLEEAIIKSKITISNLKQNFPLDMFDLLSEQAIILNKELNERKIIEHDLKIKSRIFDESQEGIMITDSSGIIIDVNNVVCTMLGYSREEIIGNAPKIFSSGKQTPEFYTQMWKSIREEGSWTGELWNKKKNGEIFAESLTIFSLLDENQEITNYIATFFDITNRKQQDEKLSLIAYHDMLTGLPNRILLVDRLNQSVSNCLRKKEQFAVCFIDLDDFKPINDNYGHVIGDILLIKVVERIKLNIREVDTLSRHGGDEFILLLNDFDSFDQCESTIKRIQLSLSSSFLIRDVSHQISASIGIALFPSDSGCIDELIHRADQAMYQAKRAGKGRYHRFNDNDAIEYSKTTKGSV